VNKQLAEDRPGELLKVQGGQGKNEL
jgi:hypothetical protein